MASGRVPKTKSNFRELLCILKFYVSDKREKFLDQDKVLNFPRPQIADEMRGLSQDVVQFIRKGVAISGDLPHFFEFQQQVR